MKDDFKWAVKKLAFMVLMAFAFGAMAYGGFNAVEWVKGDTLEAIDAAYIAAALAFVAAYNA